MSIRKTAFLITIALSGFTSTAAHGAFIVSIQQVGNNVVATGSGTINTSALTQNSGSGGVIGFIESGIGLLDLAPFGGPVIPTHSWTGIIGPSNFGSNFFANDADFGNGDGVGVFGSGNLLNLPIAYVSGATLSDSATWLNQTFSSLGVTPGTYVWTWGSGPTADSFTMIAVAPEPASMALLGVGLGSLGVLLHLFAGRNGRLTSPGPAAQPAGVP